MKQNNVRTTSFLGRISKSSLAICLALLLMLGTMATAMSAVVEHVGLIRENDMDLAESGDTTYYLHIGVNSDFRTSSGTAFTYDSTNSIYYASYQLTQNSEYPMVINTTSGSLGDDNKSSSSQTVTSLASSWNPDTIQFDYFEYKSNNYDGYDCFKLKTQTTQTVYFTFDLTSKKLVVYSSLPSGSGGGSNEVTVYFENTLNFTSAPYVYLYDDTDIDSSTGAGGNGGSGTVKAELNAGQMTLVDGDIYSITFTNSSSYKMIVFNQNNQNDYNDFYDTYCAYATDYSTAITNNTLLFTPGSSYVSRKDGHTRYYSGTWSSYDASKVTDTDLLAVLNGTKIMFYGGELTSWNQSEFKLDNSSDSDKCKTMSGSYTIDSQGTYEFGLFCVASQSYVMGHWNSGLSTTPVAGKAYVVRGSVSSSGHTQKAVSGSDYLYELSNSETRTVTTTFPANVDQGYTAAVSSTAAGNSVLGLANSIEYYISDGTNWYKFEESSGYLDTSDLAIGSYTLKTVLKDTRGLYVVADTDTFTVTAPTYYSVTVTTSSSAYGYAEASPASAVAGATVTLTAHERSGSFTGWTVISDSSSTITLSDTTGSTTFTMPSNNVTIRADFEAYSATSDWYYNGYSTSDMRGTSDTDGYAMQMTAAKVNGTEFSYYYVEARTGSNQLFTVSYKSPAHPYGAYDYIYFHGTQSDDDSSQWAKNHDIYCWFESSDGVTIKAYSIMEYAGWSEGYKMWRAHVPYGAKKVYFKDNNNGCQMGPKDLTTETDRTLMCYWANGSSDGLYNIAGFSNPVPYGFNEYFYNMDSVYYDTTGHSFGSYNVSIGGGSHAIPNPSNASAPGYYVMVLYPGNTYTINGDTVSVPSGSTPYIVYTSELPSDDVDTNTASVYAKDGTIVIDWNNKGASGATTTSGTSYGYSVIADTKIYNTSDEAIGTDHDDDGASYEVASVDVDDVSGTTVKIVTTIDSTNKARYYVKGWCVNGVTYKSSTSSSPDQVGVNTGTSDGSNGVYTMYYTIPKDTENGAKIEITPIYYLADTSNYEVITFYLEGYDETLQNDGGWGNTPYIYPFYGNNNNVDNSFGVYPGQPMVYANGRYSIEIPINNFLIDSSRDLHNSTIIKGITISNGYADHVHRNLIYGWTAEDNDADHKQTYDYDDFYKIYNEQKDSGNNKPNAIIFRIQDESDTYNRYTYGASYYGQTVPGTTTTLDSAKLSAINSGNGWNLLTNRYNQPVDLFGNLITDYASYSGDYTDNDAMHVISTGYNANIAGDYGTAWMVYYPNGTDWTLLKDDSKSRYAIPPSIFILTSDSSFNTTTYPDASHSVDGVNSYTDSVNNYKTMYQNLKDSSNDAYAVGKPVYITYEQNTQDTRKTNLGTGAYRVDGKWYYTFSSDSVHANIIIEYYDKSTGTWVQDTCTGITGNTTGCTAKFTDTNTQTSDSYLISANENFSFTCTEASGWQLDSWQIKYGESSYQKIPGAGTSASVPATSNETIVARFMPVVANDLTITHSLSSDSSGSGTTTMDVTVYTDSTMNTAVSGGTFTDQSSVYLGSSFIANNNNYYIKVVLKTTPTLDGFFDSFGYTAFGGDDDPTEDTASTPVTSTFSFAVSSLYTGTTQNYPTLAYTSKINAATHRFVINYTFASRGSSTNDKTFTVKGLFNAKTYPYETYVNNYDSATLASRTVKEDLITGLKPFESNIGKKLELNLSGATQSCSNSENVYTHTVTVPYTTSDDNTMFAVFKLPYEYRTSADSSATPTYKKYTGVVNDTYGMPVQDNSIEAFEVTTNYGNFFTSTGTQDHVGKSSGPESLNNDFITAPVKIYDTTNNKELYFSYWQIYSDEAMTVPVEKVYFIDFHYRAYGNYYIKPVYSYNPDELYYTLSASEKLSAYITRIGDSRNQWNKADGTTTDSEDVASDIIYNDFNIAYSYGDTEFSKTDASVGMFIERVIVTKDGKRSYATGSGSVSDMSQYKTEYSDTEAASKTAITAYLNGSTSATKGDGAKSFTNGSTLIVGMDVCSDWDVADLNNKNRFEKCVSFYSRYGQSVSEDSITFKNDSVVDNYVYRAYSYIIYNGTVAVSDPVYFCMKNTSSQ